MDIAGSIAAVGSALSIVKELKEIDAQVDQASLKLKVAELTSALADAKLGLVEVAEQLREKDGEIKRLAELVRYRAENLVDIRGFRYKSVGGEPAGIPLCPVCENKGLFVHLAQDRTKNGHPYTCPSCKGVFGHVSVFAYPSTPG
jgi:hypothetical protein